MSQRQRTEAEWAVAIDYYEGLVKKTATRYLPLIDDNYDDICAVFRVTVWKALVSYSTSKSRMTQDAYVFSCIVNRGKDLLRRRRREEVPLEVDLGRGEPEMSAAFEEHYLSMTEERALAEVETEPLRLPSTLTETERQVVALLYLDFRQVEIAQLLGVSRTAVEKTARSIRAKLADWRPSREADVALLPELPPAPPPAAVAA